ncbi:Toprim domain-containing protein [Pseudovibrio denitrificans]|uniref:Toprim domain-containing protein n=1 Tax=Pseudovibrio denitrificans TaxID=258256 RepID=A0A1I6ZWF7_9HYPH|nr:toprim domain-containing protein [Pseudovibrio denitrificans]SFT66992.1 Toprim domain-containing protein [Pseudovibrio denitrificans]
MSSRIKEIKQALMPSELALLELVRELVPEGRRNGKIWSAKSPVRQDKNAGSFVVWLTGPARGSFKDYADGTVKGDLIDLVCLSKRLSRTEALAWAEDRLGWRHMSPEEKEKLRRQVKKKAKQQNAQEEKRRKDRIRRALRWWHSGLAVEGTLIERYLESRAIPLSRLQGRLNFCRFLPAQEYWMDAVYENGIKVQRGPEYPAMMSRMSAPDGSLQALHFTFLAADGSGKAPVEKPKLMWPETAGSMIWISQGESKSGGPDTYRGPVVVGEGIEDAGSSALANPEIRHAAAGSLPNLLHLPDFPWLTGYILLKDNDWGKPQAQEQFNRAVERLAATGKPVIEVSSTKGKDFNDQLRGVE